MAFMANEEPNFTVNKLILGDNLEIMKTFPDEYVDLIYLDPPFFSNRNYEVIWGDSGEIRSFQDRWAGGMDHYIGWLYERVEQMHRILKPNGSIYLHCDWHANAYIRVNILDKIFGEYNFKNEIIWDYEGWVHKKMSHLPNKHDTVFFYSKSNNNKYIPLSKNWTKEEYVAKRKQKIHLDENGKEYIFDGRGNAGQRRYLDVALLEGQPITDVWKIGVLTSSSKERIGYPTQKPEALIERIISMASNKGDIVLDPFAGGGTTIVVADKLGRQWIGIDQSPMAVKVTEFRLEKQYGAMENQEALFPAPYTVHLHKYDKDTLFNEDPFKFETWIIQQFGGIPQNKKGGDAGVDGKTKEGVPIQVKQSKNIGVNVVKNFSVSAKQFNKLLFEKNIKEKKPVGFIIAFSFGRGAVEEAARLKNSENIIIKLVTVEDFVPLSVKPSVAVHINELEKMGNGERKIELTAVGNSLSGIEFYSWDFEYNVEKGKFNPSIIMDKEGRQTIMLKSGTHNIAVKAVDNDGLENTEIIKLKINGEINRE
jgi:DNA modification methylase